MEKVEFRGGGDVLEDVEKFCYLSGMLVPMVEHLNSDYKNRQYLEEIQGVRQSCGWQAEFDFEAAK